MRTLTLFLLLLNTIFSQQGRTTMGMLLQNQNGLGSPISFNSEQMDLIRKGLQNMNIKIIETHYCLEIL